MVIARVEIWLAHRARCAFRRPCPYRLVGDPDTTNKTSRFCLSYWVYWPLPFIRSATSPRMCGVSPERRPVHARASFQPSRDDHRYSQPGMNSHRRWPSPGPAMAALRPFPNRTGSHTATQEKTHENQPQIQIENCCITSSDRLWFRPGVTTQRAGGLSYSSPPVHVRWWGNTFTVRYAPHRFSLCTEV